MEVLIVTGMSGAGKTRAIITLEDIGYYCVDNLPPQLLADFLHICEAQKPKIKRVAVVVDVRSGERLIRYKRAIKDVKNAGYTSKLLFLNAEDRTLVRRYKETRRRHPIQIATNCSLEDAIHEERTRLSYFIEFADYLIDTTNLRNDDLRERIIELLGKPGEARIHIDVLSFGFKYGIPVDADLLFDVRCIDNPYYIEELREKTGLEQEIIDFVMNCPDASVLLHKLTDLLDFLVPLYMKNGKNQLVIGVGCTGGRHRSVVMADKIAVSLEATSRIVHVIHRDVAK